MMKKFFLISIGFVLLLGAGKGNRKHNTGCSATNGILPMTASCWQESGWNTASYPLPTTQQIGGVGFGFHAPAPPDSNTRHTNKLDFAGRLNISGTLKATMQISGSTQCFFWQIESFNSCCPTAPQASCGATNCQSVSPHAAEARLYFRTSSSYPFDLWWSLIDLWPLQNGSFTMQVPLQNQFWYSHNGTPGNVASYAANATGAGISFSGGCFYYHGVQGDGTFTLTDFRWF